MLLDDTDSLVEQVDLLDAFSIDPFDELSFSSCYRLTEYLSEVNDGIDLKGLEIEQNVVVDIDVALPAVLKGVAKPGHRSGQ